MNIAIAGAGLLGRLFAWRLSMLGHKVRLYEKHSRECDKSAAWTAAGMISPMSEVVVSERSIYDLGIRSMSLWEAWLQDIPQARSLYRRGGAIVLAHPQDENELQQFYQELSYHLGRDNNARWLNKSELHEFELDLNPAFERALYLPDEAHINNRELLPLLLAQIESRASIAWQKELTFEPWPKVGEQALEDFDVLLDCRGMGASDTHKKLRGVRGEVLHVQTSEVKLNRPIRLMHPRYKLYVVPKANKRFVIGATELESSDSSPMSVQSALELCSALYTINPAFAEARILEIDANLRPALNDNLPAINDSEISCASGQKKRLITINGLFRHGYLIAPALVDQVLSRL